MITNTNTETLLETKKAARLSVAPMMDWTDRHCRFFHRQFTKQALLYTEMIASAALVQGRAFHLLDHSEREQPLALQLGGSDPIQLSEAASIGESYGYNEINLNIGCPSDRVQSGSFGAVLMKNPKLVARCCEAMKTTTSIDITVKCRIGVDDQDPQEILPEFLGHLTNAGINRVIIHARKAILKGLSPKDNRNVPPLNYALVLRMKEKFPNLHISINGGVKSLEEANNFLLMGLDGVMIGRSAYQQPAQILSDVDSMIFEEGEISSPLDVANKMRFYIKRHSESGGKPHQVTRHMMGLFHGLPGAKIWKQHLSRSGISNNIDVYDEALVAVSALLTQTAA